MFKKSERMLLSQSGIAYGVALQWNNCSCTTLACKDKHINRWKNFRGDVCRWEKLSLLFLFLSLLFNECLHIKQVLHRWGKCMQYIVLMKAKQHLLSRREDVKTTIHLLLQNFSNLQRKVSYYMENILHAALATRCIPVTNTRRMSGHWNIYARQSPQDTNSLKRDTLIMSAAEIILSK